MTVLADIERNKVALSSFTNSYETDSFKVLYTIFGVDFSQPFALKILDVTNLRGFWSYARKHLSDNFQNILITGSNMDNLKAVTFNIEAKYFNMGKSYNVEPTDIRAMIAEPTKYILSVAKDSLLYDEFSNTRISTKSKEISLFTNSKYLSNQVRVNNVGEVLDLFKTSYKDTALDSNSTLPKVRLSLRPTENGNENLIFNFNVNGEEKELEFSQTTRSSIVFNRIKEELNLEVIDDTDEEDTNPSSLDTSPLDTLFLIIRNYKSLYIANYADMQNLYLLLDDTQSCPIYLSRMLFKGMKTIPHSTNFTSSGLFNPKLIDIQDNLPLDKSGYNRYLYRRQLHRRLIEHKNDKVFADYENYMEVKEFKNAETNLKEVFLKIVRSRSIAKLSHKRIKNVNLLTSISIDYARIMQLLQEHYSELRKYRMNNSSDKYNSLGDVVKEVVDLTTKLNKFIKTYKKYEI